MRGHLLKNTKPYCEL